MSAVAAGAEIASHRIVLALEDKLSAIFAQARLEAIAAATGALHLPERLRLARVCRGRRELRSIALAIGLGYHINLDKSMQVHRSTELRRKAATLSNLFRAGGKLQALSFS